jgi:hypothetical protein
MAAKTTRTTEGTIAFISMYGQGGPTSVELVIHLAPVDGGQPIAMRKGAPEHDQVNQFITIANTLLTAYLNNQKVSVITQSVPSSTLEITDVTIQPLTSRQSASPNHNAKPRPVRHCLGATNPRRYPLRLRSDHLLEHAQSKQLRTNQHARGVFGLEFSSHLASLNADDQSV